MKKYFLMLAVAITTTLHSQELEVKDLWFFGKKGIISGSLSPSYVLSTSKVTGNPDLDTENFDVNYKIHYSFMDNLKVGIAPTYSYTKSEGSTPENGFTEPVFIAEYRLLDSKDTPIYLDFGFYVSPTLGESKNDNQLRGNTQIAASIAVGQKLENFAYAFIPRIIYQTTTHNKNAEDSKSTVFYELPVKLQYDLNDKFSLIGGAAYYIVPDSNNSSGISKNDYVVLADAGVKYSIIYEMALSLTANYLRAKGEFKPYGLGSFDYEQSGFGAAATLNFGF